MAIYHLYTDASYLPRRKMGAWAWVMIEPTLDGAVYMAKDAGTVRRGPDLTNGSWSLETRAILEAVKWTTRRSRLFVYCDNHEVSAVMNGQASERSQERYRAMPVVIELERTLAEREISLLVHHIKRNSNIYAAYADHVAGQKAAERNPLEFPVFRHQWGRSGG